jgi:hypothetical protein
MAKELNYTNIVEPYNSFLERSSEGGVSSGEGNVSGVISNGSLGSSSSIDNTVDTSTPKILDGQTLDNLWINSWIKSKNYKPKSAGFLIDGMAGYIEAMNLFVTGSIVGGSLDVPDTVTSNSFHVDANGNIWSGAITLTDAKIDKFAVENTGTLYAYNGIIGGTLTIGGRLATIIGGAINADGDYINDLINARIDTEAKTILSDFSFGVSGALQIGTYVNGVSGDIKISPAGIVGRNINGDNTITISGSTGNATFAGTVVATTGTIGGFTLSTIALYAGISTTRIQLDTTYGIHLGATAFADAPFSVSLAGALKATSATIGGWTVNTTSIYTGTEDHSGYTANAGDVTLYSNGSDASLHFNKAYIDTTGVIYATGAVIDETSTIAGITGTQIGHVATSTSDSIPADLTCSSTTATVASDGSVSAQVILTWSEISTNTFDHYLIRYKKATNTYYTYITATVNTITIEGLVPNTSYHFGLASVNKYGTVSSYSSDISQTTATSTTAPATVAGVTATGGIQYIIVEFTASSSSDLSHYNIYRSLTNDSGAAVKIATVKTTYFVDGGRTGEQLYYYFIKACNTSGLESTNFSTVASATPRNVTSDDIVTLAGSKVLIDGVTYLSNWRKGGDLTKIDGGQISATSVTTTQLNFTPVQTGNVIASINASAEGITIEADNITIAGSTTFVSEASALGIPKVFYTTPTTPYRVGDLWINGDIFKKCITQLLIGAYDPAHWELATSYTGDEALTDFIEGTYATDLGSLQDQIDGVVVNWFYEGEPTLANLPASDWTTDELKNIHLGDLYYDLLTGYAYRFILDSTYQWYLVPDAGVAAALEAAANAQDTADSKRQVFTAEPTTPYNVGDLWLTSLTDSVGYLKKCITEKLTGTYDAAHWVEATYPKIKTFAQDSVPTSISAGDIWIDTNDGNKLYRATNAGDDEIASGEWVLYQDANKTTTFAQDAIPTSTAIGDLWVDTDDGNKRYRATSIGADEIKAGEWVEISDANKTTTFAQDAIPTSTAIGDLWVDTNDENKLYRAASIGADEIKAGEWILIRDSGIATAIQDAADAQSTADGKIITYAQDSIPTSSDVGDLWIDTNDGNKLYRAEMVGANEIKAGEWVLFRDTAIADAQATADGKIVSFYQDSVPTAEGAGDLWFDTNDNNKLYRATAAGDDEIAAGEWVIVPDNTRIATGGAASDINNNITTISGGKITTNTLSADAITTSSFTSKAITLAIAAGTGDSYFAGGNNLDLVNWRGGDVNGGAVIFGLDDSDSDSGKFFAGNYYTRQYAQFNGTNLIVNDSILSNQDIYGDGSDGNVTTVGNVTLTKDMYYDNLTVSAEDILNPSGYRIFVKNTLTVNGKIAREGNTGGNGSTTIKVTTPGAGGAALVAATLPGGIAGVAGGKGSGNYTNCSGQTNGVNGSSQSVCLGNNGVAGGAGGDDGFGGHSATGGTGGTATPSVQGAGILSFLQLGREFLAGGINLFTVSAGTGGGGSGQAGPAGGGSGSSGGYVLISAKKIVISATGEISVKGGTGGNGGNGNSTESSGAGGGAGGNGGVLALIYGLLENNGTLTYTGGTGGTGGTGTGGSGNGINGTSGAAGKLILLQR